MSKNFIRTVTKPYLPGYNQESENSTFQNPIDMKRGFIILISALFIAAFTFGCWFSVQLNINQELEVIEQKLNKVKVRP